MARSGSEKRQRRITHKARFTEQESALIREQAEKAGVSVASLIRYAVLGQTPLRAARRPSVSAELGNQLGGRLGEFSSALKAAAAKGTPGKCDEAVEAACRDHAEMRAIWFEAFGREP